ncbi:tRNA lysidine(34) synthetase TilS [Amylibacter marinus]|nr:tRNA lysidine(34) synthetase TilS [Amylibacter marinus]
MDLWQGRISGEKIGLAVSGGGDSMSLLYLMRAWADQVGRKIFVATVDHGLRPESSDEAQMVSERCAKLGVPCEILKWRGWDRRGNTQDEAREARARLIGEWAGRIGVCAVATGHTAEDQAETFLMRLARGSGVDGLSGMASMRTKGNTVWFRPMLSLRRDDLRQYLKTKRVKWIDDPSNEDLRFDRIKMRKAQKALDGLGLTVDRLVETATRMSTARRGLERLTKFHAAGVAKPSALGSVYLDLQAFGALPLELRYRLFAHCLMWVSGAPYRPRFDALLESAAKLSQGQDHTLLGCHILTDGTTAEVCREVSAVNAFKGGDVFDGRWKVIGPAGADIRPLGPEGLPKCPEWRALGASRLSLMSCPSVWHSDELIAAPLAGIQGEWRFELRRSVHEFFTLIVMH